MHIQNIMDLFLSKKSAPARNAAAKPLAFKQTQQIPQKQGLPQEKTNILAPELFPLNLSNILKI